MLVMSNNHTCEDNTIIKFVSYDGKYPNLCSGVLTLNIEGKDVKFGHHGLLYDYTNKRYKDEDPNNPNFDSFWSSGGGCGFHNNYSESYVNTDEWSIDVNDIPEQYRKYAAIIDEIFNDNVPHGCCGGCL